MGVRSALLSQFERAGRRTGESGRAVQFFQCIILRWCAGMPAKFGGSRCSVGPSREASREASRFRCRKRDRKRDRGSSQKPPEFLPSCCATRGSPGTVGPRASSGHHFFFACPTWGHLGHHRGSRRLCSVISAFSPCRRWGTPRASPHLGLAPGGAITVMPVRGPRGHRARATAPSTTVAQPRLSAPPRRAPRRNSPSRNSPTRTHRRATRRATRASRRSP